MTFMNSPATQVRYEIIKHLAKLGAESIDGYSCSADQIELTLLNGDSFVFRPDHPEALRYLKLITTCSEARLETEDCFGNIGRFLREGKLGSPVSSIPAPDEDGHPDLAGARLPKVQPLNDPAEDGESSPFGRATKMGLRMGLAAGTPEWNETEEEERRRQEEARRKEEEKKKEQEEEQERQRPSNPMLLELRHRIRRRR